MDRVEAISTVVKKHVDLLKDFNIFIFKHKKHMCYLLSETHRQLVNKNKIRVAKQMFTFHKARASDYF